MKGPTLVSTEQSFTTFWGARGRLQLLGGLCSSVCSLPPSAVTERTFLGTSGRWKTFLSPSPWDFLVLTEPKQLQTGHNTSLSRYPGWLLRCPLQCFMDSPLPLVKITFVKMYFFLLGSKHVTKAITLKKAGTNFCSSVWWFVIHIFTFVTWLNVFDCYEFTQKIKCWSKYFCKTSLLSARSEKINA